MLKCLSIGISGKNIRFFNNVLKAFSDKNGNNNSENFIVKCTSLRIF